MVAQTVKNLPAMQETQIRSLDQEDSPGEFHGQRSLAGYNPWGHKESNATERLTHSFFFIPGECYVDLYRDTNHCDI